MKQTLEMNLLQRTTYPSAMRGLIAASGGGTEAITVLYWGTTADELFHLMSPSTHSWNLLPGKII